MIQTTVTCHQSNLIINKIRLIMNLCSPSLLLLLAISSAERLNMGLRDQRKRLLWNG